MKDLIISQQGSTFTSALKGMKTSPSISSTSHKAFRSIQSNHFQKGQSASIFSPRFNITKRENTTLKQLFIEYQRRPDTEYILKLKSGSSMKNIHGSFDLWISNFGLQSKDNTQMNQRSVVQQRRQQLKQQICQNIYKIGLKIQNQQPSIISTVDKVPQDRSTKYSFSQYFSSSSELEQRQLPKTESVAKISIGNTETIPSRDHLSSDKDYNKDAQSLYFAKSDTSNKENSQQLSNQSSKIICGLQFSKNKRFKSTKKKRKNCQ